MKLADLLAAHARDKSWSELVVRDPGGLTARYIQMAPGEKSKAIFYADSSMFWIVQAGLMRVTIQGKEPFTATKGFVVQVPAHIIFQMETLDDAPSLRFEVTHTRSLPFYPTDETPAPIKGVTYQKVIAGNPGTYGAAKPNLDFQRDIVEGGGRVPQGFIRDGETAANIIRAPGAPRPLDTDRGHFHDGTSEFWFVLELDDALGLSQMAGGVFADTRTGRNSRHGLVAQFRQSVFGRLAGYEDVNDADRLGCDPAMRFVVGGHAVAAQAASTSQMGRFETEVMTQPDNLGSLVSLSGMWIDRIAERRPMKAIMLDMDSSVSPTFGDQENTAYSGHFGCTCYHPLFVFNQFGDLERCVLRSGNVHSADGWHDVLEPVVARYRNRKMRRFFRADAAFANPEVYEYLEAKAYKYTIRLPANQVLQEHIAHLLKRPVGRPPIEVRRYYANFSYQAQSWRTPRRVVAKVEWHPGELYPRVGFIVTNLSRPAERVVAFYNGRGTAEQWIKEGKNAAKWTRLSCCSFAANAVRLQLHALAYNLANFMRTLALPATIKHWSLTSLRDKLVKIGAKIVTHARYVTFQMAEVAVPSRLFEEILRLIDGLRRQPVRA